jgi:hypothetical protein
MMATDGFADWLEHEIEICTDRIRSIEVDGWRWLIGVGNEGMKDVTDTVLAEAKERLAQSEAHLARLLRGPL